MNLQAINDWPASIYNFAGNGATAAQNPSAANFVVNTGCVAAARAILTGVNGGGRAILLWTTASLAVAVRRRRPPDFIALWHALRNRARTGQHAGLWTGTGTPTPFATLTDNGLTIDLSECSHSCRTVMRIGAESHRRDDR